MALKDIWKDIVEGDFIDPKQINNVAHGVIDNENRTEELENEINGENGWNEQAKAAAVIAENAAKEAVSAKNEAAENASIATDKAQLATDKASEAAESAENASASEKTATNKAKEAGESANAATEAKEASEKARDDAEIAKSSAEGAATKAENAAARAENATEFLKNGALFANAVRGKIVGAIVSADDVSPIEHELDVKVTDADGAPLKGVIVKRYGKNLFANDYSEYGVKEWTHSNGTQSKFCGYAIRLPVGTYTIKARLKEGEVQTGYSNYLFSIKVGANGVAIEGSNGAVIANAAYNEIKFSINEGEVFMLYNGKANLVNEPQNARLIFEQNDIQIELGEKATKFEPFDMVEAVADADGNVEGLISHAPNMTLTTNNNEAVIECEYNRDADKVITDLETKLNTLISTIGG